MVWMRHTFGLFHSLQQWWIKEIKDKLCIFLVSSENSADDDPKRQLYQAVSMQRDKKCLNNEYIPVISC